jgi:hypothetical protein
MQEKGERLDLESVVPHPIPDEENFAAAPIFRPLFDVTVEEVVENGRRMQQERVNDPQGQAALKRVGAFPEGERVVKSSWEDGKFIDLAHLQQVYRSGNDYPKASEPQKPAEDVLLALSRFDSEIESMRVAGMRPRARFPLRYEKHFGMNLPHVQVLRSFGEGDAIACRGSPRPGRYRRGLQGNSGHFAPRRVASRRAGGYLTGPPIRGGRNGNSPVVGRARSSSVDGGSSSGVRRAACFHQLSRALPTSLPW